jgi:hypothetical protein
VSRHPSKPFSTRARWPSDHRDELVAAALVGLVVVLLGYASGIGGSSNAATAAGGPSAVIAPDTPSPTGPSPVIVRATTPDSGSGGYGGGYSGGSYGSGGTGAGAGGGAGSVGASTTPIGVPTASPSSSAVATPSPVVVGSSAAASPTPGGLRGGTVGLVGTLTGTLTSTVNTVLCGLLGVCDLSPTSTASTP